MPLMSKITYIIRVKRQEHSNHVGRQLQPSNTTFLLATIG
jgi:hypothetical protein